ncbi:MAG: thiosulfate oxidation carrier complex protein SoxZ [Gammaproteobacteria bacterium]|nr:thiosulfate oxidation carrier complex protein SoxZ [Gammaproteobacteria bacterium]MDH5803492.1 thiosulfate oxidation carrier complex protein SoxZ [Gammaproteobacteria bacterium]
MAKKSIRIRAKLKGSVTEVKALMSHPMETGLRKDKKTGEKIPEHFIQEVKCEHKGKVVATADWGPAVSKNPYLSIRFKGGSAGDDVNVSWVDNTGKNASGTAKIK